MAAGWAKARSKLGSKELEDEFEKFLNESLSDESLSSPRRSITPHGTRSKSKILASQSRKEFDKPWWATSEDDESSTQIDATNNKWLKKDKEENENEDVALALPVKTDNPLVMSRDSLDVSPSRPGTALDTILSEPEYSSYDDSKKDRSAVKGKNVSSKDGNSPDAVSRVGQPNSTTATHETSNVPGFDTLEEIKDKDAFFSDLEKEETGKTDFKELNKRFDENNDGHISSLRHSESPRAIGVEGLTPYNPPQYDDSDSSSQIEHQNVTSPSHSYKTDDSQYNETDHDSIDGKKNATTEEEATEEQDTVKKNEESLVKTEVNPSGLLSKVGLMESLDSTAGLNLAAKLSKLQKINKGSADKTKLDESKENTTTSGNMIDMKLDTGHTTAELENALQKVTELSTQSSSFDHEFKDNVELINDVRNIPAVQSGMLLLDKDQIHTGKIDEFSLKPVISNFADEPKVISSSAIIRDSTMQSEYETQSFLGHAHLFNTPDMKYEKSKLKFYMNTQDENEGFALQAIKVNENEEDDSPSTESLKSIKSIAEERKKKILEKAKSLQEDMKFVKKKVAKTNIPTSRKGVTKSSTTMKKLEQKSTLSKPPIKPNSVRRWKTKSTNISLVKTPAKREDTNELIKSVESFATYLKEFSHGEDGIEQTSKTSFTGHQDVRLASLDREQSLQKEVQQLRLAYEDERRRNERQHEDMLTREKAWTMEREQLCCDYDSRLKNLHEDVFVLQKKLEMGQEEEQGKKKLLDDVKNKIVKELTEEEFEKFRKQLEQQESLLNGYQQENERLYNDVKKRDVEKKKFEGKMFKENQRLASEVGNLKEQLENRCNIESYKGSASLGASRITQLDNQVKFYQKREVEYKEEIVTLENEVSSLKRVLSLYEKQKNVVSTDHDLQKQIESLKVNHHAEISKLQKRLNWYAENQQLLDRDAAALIDKRDEIKELRQLVERLENEIKTLRKEKAEKSGERNTDAKKISDLQRQVKEMEDILRRRNPNSIPAMIIAASATPGESKSYKVNEPDKPSLSNLFLEKRIRTLEKELEEKDSDSGKKIRAIEQRYSAMSMRYEEHIKQLDVKMADLMVKLRTESSVESLEGEISKLRIAYEDLLHSRNSELNEKQADISRLKLEISELKRKQKLVKRDVSKSYPALQKEVSKFRENLRYKSKEITQLQTTVLVLQKEREKLLSERKYSKSMQSIPGQPVENSPYLTDRMTSPIVVREEVNEKVLTLEMENKNLRNTIEELRIRCEEKRLKYEALEAKTLYENRTLREEYEERHSIAEESHKIELEKLKMNFIVEHSNSKVAELSGKISSYELMIEHLKASLDEAKGDRDNVSKMKKKEELLREEISQLRNELQEARKHHTPEMHHYKLLEGKIQNMETKYAIREKELQTIIETTRHKASVDIDFVEDKWRDILLDKDRELQHFREELDSIIEVLEELQRQGVILPNHRINTHI